MRVSKKNSKLKRDFVSREVKKILKEQDEWDGWFGAAQANAFIAPFTDVLKVAKVAAKDILVSTANVAKQVVTFDLEKKKEIEDKYRQTKQEIAKEYAEAMKPIDDALAADDTKMLAFALNPGLFAATSLAKGAAAAGKPILDYAASKIDLPEFRADDDDNKARDDRKNAASGGKGPLLGLLGDLNKIFFSPLDTAGDLLMAADDPLQEQQASNPKVDDQAIEIAKAALEDLGILKSVEAAGKKRVDEKLQEVEALEKEFTEVMEATEEFKNSESLSQAKEVAARLEKSGLDLKPQIASVEKAISDQMKALEGEQGSQIKNQLIRTGSPLAQGLTADSDPKDFRPIVERTVLNDSLQEALGDVREDMFKQIMSFVSEGMSVKELRDVGAVSPLGKKYADAILGLADRLSGK